MKIDYLVDMDGRFILLEQRAKMIGHALQAIATTDAVSPDPEALESLGLVAIELAEDITGLHAAYITEADASRRVPRRRKS